MCRYFSVCCALDGGIVQCCITYNLMLSLWLASMSQSEWEVLSGIVLILDYDGQHWLINFCVNHSPPVCPAPPLPGTPPLSSPPAGTCHQYRQLLKPISKFIHVIHDRYFKLKGFPKYYFISIHQFSSSHSIQGRGGMEPLPEAGHTWTDHQRVAGLTAFHSFAVFHIIFIWALSANLPGSWITF